MEPRMYDFIVIFPDGENKYISSDSYYTCLSYYDMFLKMRKDASICKAFSYLGDSIGIKIVDAMTGGIEVITKFDDNDPEYDILKFEMDSLVNEIESGGEEW